MPRMDTTPEVEDPLERVEALLASLTQADPADAVGPMTEIADLLERALGDGEDA